MPVKHKHLLFFTHFLVLYFPFYKGVFSESTFVENYTN